MTVKYWSNKSDQSQADSEHSPLEQAEVAPECCPLCGQPNSCAQLETDSTQNCWCMAGQWKFTEDLLTRVPKALQGKACICRRCVELHNAE